jgi:hypothetical protein
LGDESWHRPFRFIATQGQNALCRFARLNELGVVPGKGTATLF